MSEMTQATQMESIDGDLPELPGGVTFVVGRERHMPSLSSIAEYWRSAPETATVLPKLYSHWIGWGEPFCFACGWLAPVLDGPGAWAQPLCGGWLDRAHLIDHSLSNGSDDPFNIVPLCHFCHDAMPPFDNRAEALEWVTAHESMIPHPWLWQLFTDEVGRGRRREGLRGRSSRLRGDYLTLLVNATDAPTVASHNVLRQAVLDDPRRHHRVWEVARHNAEARNPKRTLSVQIEELSAFLFEGQIPESRVLRDKLAAMKRRADRLKLAA